MMEIPKIPLGPWIKEIVAWAQDNLVSVFGAVTLLIDFIVSGIENVFTAVPPIFFIILVMVLVWAVSGWKTALVSTAGLFLIYNLGLWEPATATLALVLSATIFALVVGVPIGIFTARSEVAHKLVMPVLDFMQTMPPFVYLIPAVLFFGLGMVPGLIATVVFAMPPAIRLTGLGIRQVPGELVEAAEAFGSTEWQKLKKVQLPLALPTIMAGVNQCIMLSLSMVVIAAMIGAGGLGSEVLAGISRLDIAQGFEGGLAIVIIAIILDRLTQGMTGRRTAG